MIDVLMPNINDCFRNDRHECLQCVFFKLGIKIIFTHILYDFPLQCLLFTLQFFQGWANFRWDYSVYYAYKRLSKCKHLNKCHLLFFQCRKFLHTFVSLLRRNCELLPCLWTYIHTQRSSNIEACHFITVNTLCYRSECNKLEYNGYYSYLTAMCML